MKGRVLSLFHSIPLYLTHYTPPALTSLSFVLSALVTLCSRVALHSPRRRRAATSERRLRDGRGASDRHTQLVENLGQTSTRMSLHERATEL